MRLREIIAGYSDIYEDDGAIKAIVTAADRNMDIAKRQKKQAEVSKLKTKVADKQSELSSIGAIKPTVAS